MVTNCTVCTQERTKKAEPLIPSIIPDRSWQKIKTDLFQLRGKMYIMRIDYFPRYVEIGLSNKPASQEVVTHMKSWFARHGIPDKVISHNSPQFSF